LPPEYGTELLTPEADDPEIKLPVFVEELQFKALILPGNWLTTRVSEQVCPPMFNAKLALPLPEGVPAIV
jgi:hypothetical protein